ncbi:MAG: PRC-barrel domain-containing protein [Thermodesulfobacteriota bacterium]
MNKILILLSFLVVTAFLGGIVYSHADQSISQSATTKAQAVSVTKESDRAHVFSDLKRASVKDSRGQYLGGIADFVVNPDGRISFAVLSPFGMYGGMNERLVALPFDVLSFNDKYLVLNTTSEKLVTAPLFSRSYLNARNWDEDANRFFGIQPSWGEGTLCKKPAIGVHQLSMTKGWNRPYGASEIVGTQVKNPQGEVMGKIDDLVFDDEGRISFAILGYGGFLGIGQNLVAVPITSLFYAGESRDFVLNATKENIQSAPLFSKKALDDPGWANGFYRYFGQQPYWTTKEK